PYLVTLDSTLLQDGQPHTLTVYATNIGGVIGAKSVTATASNDPIPPKTFYISKTGSDANNGSLAAPWATPRHNLRCGDTILVQPGTYSFGVGQWGTVFSCPSPTGIYMAKLQCNVSVSVQDCWYGGALGSSAAGLNIDKDHWAAIGGLTTGGC